MPEISDIVVASLAAAKRAGAEAADAIFIAGQSLEISIREGKTEKLERSEGQDLGLRVFVGKSQAIVSTSKLDPETIAKAAERAVAMARLAPADPFAGLADPSCLAKDVPDLDLADSVEADEQQLLALACAAEAAALAVRGVSKSAGSGSFNQPPACCARNEFGISARLSAHGQRFFRIGHRRQRWRYGARLRLQLRGPPGRPQIRQRNRARSRRARRA